MINLEKRIARRAEKSFQAFTARRPPVKTHNDWGCSHVKLIVDIEMAVYDALPKDERDREKYIND